MTVSRGPGGDVLRAQVTFCPETRLAHQGPRAVLSVDLCVSGGLPPLWGCPAVDCPQITPSPRSTAQSPSKVVHDVFAELPLQLGRLWTC